MVYVGLDLHKRYITACAVASDGKVMAEVRQLSPDWEVLARWLGGLGAPLTVVLEATLYCWWLERQLTAAGYTAVVVNAYQVKLIWQTRTKTDPIDAHKLAELARVGMLPALWVPDPRTRALRQALRGRVFLVRQRTVIRTGSMLPDGGEPALSTGGSLQQGGAGVAGECGPAAGGPALRGSAGDAGSPCLPDPERGQGAPARMPPRRREPAPADHPAWAPSVRCCSGGNRTTHSLPERPGTGSLRGPHAEHAEFGREDPARRHRAREPVAEVDPDRDSPGTEAGARARGRAL